MWVVQHWPGLFFFFLQNNTRASIDKLSLFFKVTKFPVFQQEFSCSRMMIFDSFQVFSSESLGAHHCEATYCSITHCDLPLSQNQLFNKVDVPISYSSWSTENHGHLRHFYGLHKIHCIHHTYFNAIESLPPNMNLNYTEFLVSLSLSLGIWW
jgi:hypothetical protein